MANRYSLLTNSLFFAILLHVCTREYYAYVPPTATVEPLHPVGLRISIPDEQGITLVAFHVKFNEDFDGLEAGHIAKDILKIRNERWIYEDRHTQLKRDDIIYYWIHVVYQGLGYNLLDQSHRVINFYNYNGSEYLNLIQNEQNCTTKSATWIFENGNRQQACPHQLLFEDNFDKLDDANWKLIQRFAGSPDYEFVIYMTNDVTTVSDGLLRIKPILTNTKFGKNFVTRGRITLDGCTDEIDITGCQRQAIGWSILPPLISGHINTKGKFEFLFGHVKIRAKLPRGDWVYPVITLTSAENTWEFGLHREIRIASSPGNEELKSPEGVDINGRILCAGALIVSLNESNVHGNNHLLPRRSSRNLWSDSFHVFEIKWKSGLIIIKVDDIEYGEQNVDNSFDKPSYLTLAVAVGGVHEFPDFVMSNNYVKPWQNVEAKAMYNFYRAKNSWYPTWDTRTALQVDYVKVWAL